ncbi:carboxypeptidase-like regulatory domain-containing protein [Flammeovirga kamogawensis]|nr:TonB-dependent receptor plug domain-containing protein [Flammeovirga kamogawensis]
MTNVLQAQDRVVKGIVKESGSEEPLPGVNVLIQGTSTGSTTDFNGEFSLSIPEGSTLVFSYVGYMAQEVVVGNQSVINVSLEVDAEQLEEVVVTALGVERSSKSLTYSTQSVSSEELTTVKDPNMMNALSGKVAGLQVNKSGSGAGGSVKITLRGNTSVAGSNSPLYVVDGMPLAGSGATQANNAIDDAGRDGGDGVSNLNPEDIESINVLKGAAASALYGSQAANGVILITTKKGHAGHSKITFSSNFTVDSPMLLPETQSKYNIDGSAVTGESLNSEDFFKNGLTWVNAISATKGGENSQTYLSYAYTDAQGVIETNTFNKHNFTARNTSKMYDGKLELSAGINYIHQEGNNRPGVGTPMNAIASALLSPRGISKSDMQNYEVYDPVRKIYVQNWQENDTQYLTDNPYWVLNRNMIEETRDRFIVTGKAKYNISDWLWAQGRISIDNTTDVWDRKAYATTNTTSVGFNENGITNGGYFRDDFNNNQVYADAIINGNKKFGNLSITGLLGTSITDQKTYLKRIDTGRGTLKFANLFSSSALPDGNSIVYEQTQRQVQSVFGSFQFGFKDMVFLDVTGRNDWSSTLPEKNNSYFYPSVGLTAVLNEMVKMPEVISLAKIRGTYTMLGNDAPFGVTTVQHTINPYTGSLERANTAPFGDLKPESSRSLELGAELEMFNGLLYFDFNYYKTNTEDQLIRVLAPSGSEYTYNYVNTGNIQNQGYEIALTAIPVSKGDVTWTTTFNFSKNENKVVELYSDDPERIEWLTDGANAAYSLGLKQGGSYGDIYGYDFAREEDGTMSIDSETGLPYRGAERVKVGNSNPDFMLGWSNSVKYKNFTLNMLIDGKFGGEIVSFTQSYMDSRGTSKSWADAVEGGTVTVEGVELPALDYYATVSGRDGVTSQYVYDATNIRLRELSVAYTFAQNFGVFEDLTLSAVGRNLFFFYNNAPFDPDITSSSGNGMQGLDFFGVPATRSFGMNLRVNF